MMMNEPQCIVWKRLGAEDVRKKLKGLTLSEELDFWHIQTEKLKNIRDKYKKPRMSTQFVPDETNG